MKKFTLVFIVFVCLFGNTKAQWTQGTGVDGGDIRCLTRIGTDIYAGSQYGGIFRSSNNGESWTSLLNGLPGNASVSKIIASGSTLFTGTGGIGWPGMGIYRSVDNGENWTSVNNGIPATGISAITGLSVCGPYIFASTQYAGIYRSDNNGDSWENADSDTLVAYNQAQDVCSIGTTLFAGTQFGGAYRSSDYGVTWTAINTGFPSGCIIYALSASGTNLYARTSNGFFWSPANGDYWITINSGITQPYYTRAFYAEGSTMYCSTYESSEGPKTYKSTNGGSTWTEIPSISGGTGYYVMALLFNGNNVYAGNIGNYGFSSNGGGIIRSTDAGATWSPASIGISALNCTAITSNGTAVFAGSRYYSGIYASSDNGTSWTRSFLPGTTTNYQILSMLNVGSTIYAGNNTYSSSGGVYKSSDNGQTWTATGTIGKPVYALGANSSYLFAGTSNDGMRRSSNSGSSWTTINSGLTTIGQKSIRAIAVNGSKIYIGTTNGVYRSVNDGTSWVAANGGSGSTGYTSIKSLIVKGDTLLAGTASGIVRSFDNGATWSSVYGNNSIWTLALDGQTLYAGGAPGTIQPGGVVVSTDWGQTWTGLNATFPTTPAPEIYSLHIAGNKLYAGTYGLSVWSYDLAPPTIAPIVTTTAATSISNSGAVLNGTVNANNSTTAVTFQYGLTDSYGTTVTAIPPTVTGNTTTPVSAGITGLLPNTLYHYRAVGINSGYTVNGGDMTFTTSSSVIFNVDMSTAEGFIPGTDQVYLSGNFPGASWNEPGSNPAMMMTEIGSTLVYSLILSLPEGTYEYKYFKNAGWGGGEYAGEPNRSAVITTTTSINDIWGGEINWANLQWPGAGSIAQGDAFDVYAQAYIPNGITASAGETYGLQAWIGYSTDNSDPATWTNWILAPFNGQSFDNDEFKADLGATITTAGTYYYASRFQFGSGSYHYGGFSATNGGLWDGVTNVSGVLTITAPITKNLNLKVFLESVYSGSGLMNEAIGSSGPQFGTGIADQVTIELHNSTSPYAQAYAYTSVNLNTNGTLTTPVSGSITGSYYVVIRHRNSLETWSSSPVSFLGNPVSYDFSTSSSAAYGDNLKQIGLIYAIYAGDATQDGVVDGSDMAEIDNASTSILTGYYPQDINGDGVVDGSDMAIIDNNATSIVQVQKP